MCGSTGANRTRQEVWEFLTSKGASVRDAAAKGVGVFVVPAPETGVLDYKAVCVDGIDYSECRKRGAHCASFEWIPFGFPAKLGGKTVVIKSSADLKKLAAACLNAPCVACPMGCHCDPGDVICKPIN